MNIPMVGFSHIAGPVFKLKPFVPLPFEVSVYPIALIILEESFHNSGFGFVKSFGGLQKSSFFQMILRYLFIMKEGEFYRRKED